VAFVKSAKVVEVLDIYNSNQILGFARNHVFPHEELYARCHFLRVRAFDAWTNTPHEGTNRGSKYCENRVLPNMSQAQSTKILTEQDEARSELKTRQVADAFHKTQLHASTPTVQHIQKEAESHLQEEMDEAVYYLSIRLDVFTWLVLRGMKRTCSNSPIPVYERVRLVKVDKDGKMSCDCGFYDRNGVPDCHMAHVALYYGIGFVWFSHHDIDLRFHNTFCHFVATRSESSLSDEELAIRSSLLKLRKQDLPIPQAPLLTKFEDCSKFAIGSSCNIVESNSGYEEVSACIQRVREKKVSVLNYTDAEVASALRAFERGGDNAAGFTQSQHNCESSDGDDDGIAFPAWDEPTTASTTQGTARRAIDPVIREYQKAIENSTPNSKRQSLEMIQEETNRLNARRRVDMEGLEPPRGRRVSVKLKARKSKGKHVKQI